jgi:2-polyprenyl-3-methyl-5-hydroxy-6-metoxy-1,4-benzoquinol methylase
MANSSYDSQLVQEAELWGTEAEKQAQTIPPDWCYHRGLRHNVIMHATHIEELLAQVRPGVTALELGCASGWLTLAMAQHGAQATGLDISEKALEVARAYYASIQADVSGSVTYRAADLNTLELPPDHYDIIAVKGTLHHLVDLIHVIGQLSRALKPGGLLWIADSYGDEAPSTVLIASALMFLLPTHVRYLDKLRGLMRFGVRAPSRIKASMEAEGLSPFEGAGREHDWLKLVQQHFTIERRVDSPAFTGYLTAQLNLPDSVAIPLLRLARSIDLFLVRRKLLRNTGLVLYARKP